MGAKPVNFADKHSNNSSYGLRSKKDQQIWANASSFKLGLRSISKFCKTKIGLYFSLTLLPCTATVEKQTIIVNSLTLLPCTKLEEPFSPAKLIVLNYTKNI